jgi:protein-L-isoaspartate(D-aspartate) O-methyltransferase
VQRPYLTIILQTLACDPRLNSVPYRVFQPPPGPRPPNMNFEAARNQMLAQQIRTWNVLDDRVLTVLRSTPRELFVPQTERDMAFADAEIPLAHGQSMMTPKVEARMLQDLMITPFDDVLEIGTGSGYVTACLAQLGRHVHSIEIFGDLAASAAARLREQRLTNIEVETLDATKLSGQAEYDVIAVTASVPVLTDQFVRMLRPNGRLFIVVGRAPVMEAQLVTMHADGDWTASSLFETMLRPMINAEEAEPFVL